MVEPLRELNRICQKPDYKSKGNWMARHITREMAIPITWLVLHTPLSANAITLISILISFAGMLFLACPHKVIFFIGALLFQLWYLLDHVDGQVARYRKQSSLTGLYFDFLSHYVVHSLLFFGLSLHAYFSTRFLIMLFLGFLGSFGFALLQTFFDCKYRAYYVGLKNSHGKSFRVRQSKAEVRELEQMSDRTRQLFARAYKVCEIHVFMNLVGLVAILNLGIPGITLGGRHFSLPVWFFLIWSLLVPAVFSLRAFHTIRTKSVDRDFEDEFEALP